MLIQHWFRQWLGTDQMRSHYLDQTRKCSKMSYGNTWTQWVNSPSNRTKQNKTEQKRPVTHEVGLQYKTQSGHIIIWLSWQWVSIIIIKQKIKMTKSWTLIVHFQKCYQHMIFIVEQKYGYMYNNHNSNWLNVLTLCCLTFKLSQNRIQLMHRPLRLLLVFNLIYIIVHVSLQQIDNWGNMVYWGRKKKNQKICNK